MDELPDPELPQRTLRPPSDDDVATAQRKTEAEIAKLKAERDAIVRPFYQRYEFYAALAPFVIAGTALFYTWRTGGLMSNASCWITRC
jgi:hypothetical protein